MEPKEFEALIHRLIPITRAMGFQVSAFSPERVEISAPLEPNINHKATAFGGSIHCLATVCGWAVMHANFQQDFPEAHIVIQKSSIRYLAPVEDDFCAVCAWDDPAGRQKLLRALKAFGKGRLTLAVQCFSQGRLAAEYEGVFAIVR